LERVKLYLEKYNTEFWVDSNKWYTRNETTNIYVKSKKEPNEYINMLEIIDDKSNCQLYYNRKKTETNFNSSGTILELLHLF